MRKNSFMVNLDTTMFVGATCYTLDNKTHGISFLFQKRAFSHDSSFHAAGNFAELHSGPLGDKEYVDAVLYDLVYRLTENKSSYII